MNQIFRLSFSMLALGLALTVLMELAIQRANASIHQMAQDHAKFSMMATTIVGLHLHDLESLRLHLRKDFFHRMRGPGVHVMHQDNALAVFVEPVHYRCHDLFRLAHLEIEGVVVGRECRDVTGAEIGQQFRWLHEHWPCLYRDSQHRDLHGEV